MSLPESRSLQTVTADRRETRYPLFGAPLVVGGEPVEVSSDWLFCKLMQG